MSNKNIPENLKSQGYKRGTLKDLSYVSEIGDKEKSFIKKFQKSASMSTNYMVVILAFIMVMTLIIAVVKTDFDPPVMRIFLPAFIWIISLPSIIFLLIRTYGPKKVGYAEITTKFSRTSSGKSHQTLYFVNIIQTYPDKIYVENVQVYNSQYEILNPGDKVVVVKSIYSSTVFKDN